MHGYKRPINCTRTRTAMTATWDQRVHVWDLEGPGKGNGPVPEAASLLQLNVRPTCLAVSPGWGKAGGQGHGVVLVGDYEGGVHALCCTV